MTNEDDIPEIPDIISGIEGSLRTPDPAAIHAGLSKRQAVRKRVLGAAGAVVAVVAIGAGALAVTGDDATTTETASDDGVGFENLSSRIEQAPAVAEDSAPIEIASHHIAGHHIAGPARVLEASEGAEQFEFLTHVALDAPNGALEFWITNGCEEKSFSTDSDQPVLSRGRRIGQFTIGATVPVTNTHLEKANIACATDSLPKYLDSRIEEGDVVSVERTDAFRYVLTSGGDNPWNMTVEILTTTTVPATTTTTEPVIAGPPAFSPSSNTVLSGRWEPVGMWKDGAAINLGGFRGNISVFGRSLSGNDGCNSHGSGGFYATPEGQAQLRPGVTTLVGCPESEILSAFNAGTFGANRWGRTSVGNLVLTNGSVVIEFALAEAAPTGSLRNLSAPLNTIWRSAQVADYDNFGPDGSGVTLTFSSDDGWDTAVVEVEDCLVYSFDVSHAEGSEGSIAFTESSAAGDAGCELTDNQTLAIKAMSRANYFVTAGGNVQFWDGPQPLAVFAHEEE